jgi:hypothetical protein
MNTRSHISRTHKEGPFSLHLEFLFIHMFIKLSTRLGFPPSASLSLPLGPLGASYIHTRYTHIRHAGLNIIAISFRRENWLGAQKMEVKEEEEEEGIKTTKACIEV